METGGNRRAVGANGGAGRVVQRLRSLRCRGGAEGRLAGARARAAPRLVKKVDTATNGQDALPKRREAASRRIGRRGSGAKSDDDLTRSHFTYAPRLPSKIATT